MPILILPDIYVIKLIFENNKNKTSFKTLGLNLIMILSLS